MIYQSLGSKWPAAKARRESMSFATCNRGATSAWSHFEANPSGRSSLGEFPRRSLVEYRKEYTTFTRFLKFPKLLAAIGKPYLLRNTDDQQS